MSIVEDFAAIKEELAKLEKAKQPMNVKIEEGKPTDWTDIDTVYGFAYTGGPRNPEDDLTCFKTAFADYTETQRRYLSPFYQTVLFNGSANRKD